MEENRDFMYYGRYGDKPKLGVEYFMIDQHVKRIIDNALEKFAHTLDKEMDRFRKEFPELQKLKYELGDIEENLSKLTAKRKLKEEDELNDVLKKTRSRNSNTI